MPIPLRHTGKESISIKKHHGKQAGDSPLRITVFSVQANEAKAFELSNPQWWWKEWEIGHLQN